MPSQSAWQAVRPPSFLVFRSPALGQSPSSSRLSSSSRASRKRFDVLGTSQASQVFGSSLDGLVASDSASRGVRTFFSSPPPLSVAPACGASGVPEKRLVAYRQVALLVDQFMVPSLAADTLHESAAVVGLLGPPGARSTLSPRPPGASARFPPGFPGSFTGLGFGRRYGVSF